MTSHQDISDKHIYLERMSKPLQEKLRVAHYIPAHAKNILDVGCADGTITLELARMFPEVQFLGIDLDESFIALANMKAKEEGLTNVRFECVYLRNLLSEKTRFDSILFISVLHEFYSYGSGISSVMKAVADAEELLAPKGDIIIRDMILLEYTKHTSFAVSQIREKVSKNSSCEKQLKDFELHFGVLDTVYKVNHFLLKYMYVENWDRECTEHYVPVTFEQYERIFSLLGLELVLRDSKLLPYLKALWEKDFGLNEEELAPLRTTGFLVARKF